MAQKTETVFRKRVTAFLKTLKNTAYFPIQQTAIRGTPDFLLCVQGQFIALELKASEKSKASKLQIHNLEWIYKTGGGAFLVYPGNWPEIQAMLKQGDEKHD